MENQIDKQIENESEVGFLVQSKSPALKKVQLGVDQVLRFRLGLGGARLGGGEQYSYDVTKPS